MKRSMAERKMLTPNARRNVPLKNEPRIVALVQPKVNLLGAFVRSDNWMYDKRNVLGKVLAGTLPFERQALQQGR